MKTLVTLFYTILGAVSFGQPNETAFEKIDSINTVNPKYTIVFIHTNWCKYCKKMQASTLQNEKVIEMLNDSFWFNSLDAEGKEPIEFNNTIFKYVPNGNNVGDHELATALGTVDEELNYPTICILNAKYEIVFQYAGYLSSKEMLTVLKSSFNSKKQLY
jgi:thioredoxin-related protein